MNTAKIILLLLCVAGGIYLIHTVSVMAEKMNREIQIRQELAQVGLNYSK